MIRRKNFVFPLLALAMLLVASVGYSGAGAESGTTAEMEMVDIHWYFAVQKMPEDQDLQMVNDKLNEILETEINAHVVLEPTTFATFKEKAPLMLASGEDVDLIFIAPWINKYVPNVIAETVLPLDDLLQTYAPDYWKQMPKATWDAARVGGKVYGAINQQIFASSQGFWINNDLARGFGKDPAEINTMAVFEDYLEWIRDNKKGMIPFVNPGADPFGRITGFDGLAAGSVGVFYDDKSRTVVNYAETDTAREAIAHNKDWVERGLLGSDVVTGSDVHSALSAGSYGAYAHVYKPIGGKELETLLGGEWSCPRTEDGAYFIATGGTVATMTAIAATCKNPERAAMLLNVVNTNEEFYNTLIYGLEGTHWKWVDQSRKLIEIIDAQASGYNINVAWELGSTFNAYYTDAGLADIDANKVTQDYNNDATPSVALGFTFNSEPVKTQVAQLTAVNKEYQQLSAGLMDVGKLEEYIEKQKDAGLQDIIDECQKQLDAWVASNE